MRTRARSKANATVAIYRTKEEYVADYLREGILSGQIARGERLKQADLAEQLGLSITPVREALKLLAAEGYVHGATHRGAVVAPFDLGAATEIVELRALLEPRLIVRAMRRMTLRDMEQLQLLAQQYERASEAADPGSALGSNYRFHRFIFSLAHEPLNMRFAQVLWAKYPFDITTHLPGRIGRACREHARIIDAVISRNEDAAAIATRDHIFAAWEELKAAIAADPDLCRSETSVPRTD